jgi:hypothetical protein
MFQSLVFCHAEGEASQSYKKYSNYNKDSSILKSLIPRKASE